MSDNRTYRCSTCETTARADKHGQPSCPTCREGMTQVKGQLGKSGSKTRESDARRDRRAEQRKEARNRTDYWQTPSF